MYTSTLDTIGLKRLAERLDRLAEEIPSLRYDATMVRAEYHHAKGDHEQAFAISKPILDATEDRAFIGRSNAMATYCRGLNRLGRHAEAKATLLPLIERLTEADRRVAALYVNLDRELAHAHAGLGDHEAAARVIDEALQRYKDSEHPLLLGNLHSTAAALAMAAGDYTRATAHARLVEHWFRATDNPVLIAQTEKLCGACARSPALQPKTSCVRLSDLGRNHETAGWQTALSELIAAACGRRACRRAAARAGTARSRAGYLFTVRSGEALLIAPRHGEEPSDALLARVRAAANSGSGVSAPLASVETGEVETRAQTRGSLGSSTTEARYEVYALEDPDDGDDNPDDPSAMAEGVLGVLAVLVPPARLFRQPRPEFLRALGRALFPKASTQTREELHERAGS